MEKITNLTNSYIPFPSLIINREGIIMETSEDINKVFAYDGIVGTNIFAITGIKVSELFDASVNDIHPVIDRNEKSFRITTYKIDDSEFSNLIVLFIDITSLEDLKDRYNNEKPCAMRIEVDNYDDLINPPGSSPNLELSSEIDRIVRQWAAKLEASINRTKNSNYIVWFEQGRLKKLIDSKFEILDEIRALETEADFPASLSIGIGLGGKTLAQTEQYASIALDLALGRGGDQAVIKRNAKIEYYGGKLQTVEKSNKGKSRIVGHALKQLISQSDKIFIMGHISTDMDAFGAALGLTRFALLSDKEPYIVIENPNDSLETLYKETFETGQYNFATCEQAIKTADRDSLVIVVDTHRPSMVQCPELLDICDRIVVIDHHRKVEDVIENPVLQYMESYASSTCELVTEILQYMTTKKSLEKIEAEALLSGITVDTNSFSIKTGVRTFEAAAWLRRQGADPTEVKRYFQEDMSSLRVKTRALSYATVSNGIAITTCEQERSDAQLLCAMIADQLLNIKGVQASFAIGSNTDKKTVISARSLGEINVQTIMERFGGGGHLTTAAAQVDDTIEETVNKIMVMMEVNDK